VLGTPRADAGVMGAADDPPPGREHIEEARRLREEAAEVRRGLGPVVARLREQRAALRRGLQSVREALSTPTETRWRPSKW